jgi:drug/metabolite transporter (DMT)-like permease
MTILITIFGNVLFQAGLLPLFPYPLFISLTSLSFPGLFMISAFRKGYSRDKWTAYIKKSPFLLLNSLLSNTLYNWSLMLTSMSAITVISSLSTVFSLLFARLLLNTPVNLSTLISIHLSVIGCILVTTSSSEDADLLSRLGSPYSIISDDPESYGSHMLGCGLALISAALSALSTVLFRRLKIVNADLHLAISGSTGLVCFILFLVVNTFFEIERLEFPQGQTGTVWAYIVINGIVSSVIGYKLYMKAMARLSPVTVNVLNSLTIPLAVIVDYWRGQIHAITPVFLFGSLLVLLSTIFIPVEQDETDLADTPPLESSEPQEMSLLSSEGIISDVRTTT